MGTMLLALVVGSSLLWASTVKGKSEGDMFTANPKRGKSRKDEVAHHTAHHSDEPRIVSRQMSHLR
jgi:hypothetical protein